MPAGARTVAAAAALAVVAACTPQRAAERNLILITLDTTRADRLGCYGSQTVHTPNLDSIAEHGTVFDHAFAVAPITAPSHTSILSGTFPPFHQVHDNDIAAVPAGVPWLPEIVGNRGYRTAAMVAAFPLRSAMGFARGFDYFGDQLEAPPGSFVITNLHTVGVASRPGERISEEFSMWLAANRGQEPFFVWLHYYDPHWPWEPRGGYAELYPEQPYNGEIASMDDSIGVVLRTLAEAGLAETTGLVVVADHGEALMDHGELTHGLLLYNATVRVPLIVRLPWLEEQRPRVDTFVSNADVMPTILDALGIDPGALELPIQARSLMPLLASTRDGSPADPAWDRSLYFETFYAFYHYRWSPLAGFAAGGRKYIHGPTDELYDLRTDPDERRSLGEPEEVAALAEQLERLEAELRWDRPSTSHHQQSREELEKLRALGYVGGEAADDPESVADLSSFLHPREAMPIFFKYNDIMGLIQTRRFAEALNLARSIADADPRQKDARLTVASLSAQLGRFEAADQAFAELIEDFAEKDVIYQAGVYFQHRSDLERARDCFERLIADDPGDLEAMTRLAEVAASEESDDEARRLLEATLAINSTYREAMLGLAVLLDRQGIDEAEDRFRAVATRYPFDPRISFDYGIFLLRHGRDAEAVERLRRATALSSGPLFAAAQFALASHYESQGDIDRARACLREVVIRTDNPMALQQAQDRLAALGAE
jgi:arylsulfatase A-like enzyme/Tfp pilus assembly protein PilF